MSWRGQNTRFICSPEAAAESLPTCLTESGPCAPSRLKNTSGKFSPCASPTCRYGTTCGHSEPTTQTAPECSQTFENTAMTLSLPGAFLAKIFHAREKARAYAAREADFGRSFRVSFAKFDHDSYSWKIPHFLFQGDWATFSQTWPRYGMMVRGECYPLPPWAQDTGATAFGELSGGGIEDGEGSARMFGTSPCRNAPRSAAFKTKTPNLGELVEEERARRASAPWPTPTCAGLDGGSNSRRAAKARGRYIEGAGAGSATGPTPTANAAKPVCKEKARDALNYAVERGETKSHTYPTVGTRNMGGCSGSFAKLKHLVEIGRLPPEDARGMAGGMKAEDGTVIENCGMLNPDWVEWLMDWPIYWTDVDFRNTDGGRCRFVWLDPADDPADWPAPLMERITRRKANRVNRIETLGNGQVPLCAAVAFAFGFEIMRVVIEGRSAA